MNGIPKLKTFFGRDFVFIVVRLMHDGNVREPRGYLI